MSFFAVTYKYSAPESELAKVRSSHREYLASLSELQLSGPFVDEPGALLIFKAPSAADVAKLLDDDPFMVAGFIGERTIRGWNPVLGSKIDVFK